MFSVFKHSLFFFSLIKVALKNSNSRKLSWHSKLNQRIWDEDFPCNKKESKFIQFAVTGFKNLVGEHKKDSENKVTQNCIKEIIQQHMKRTEKYNK